MRPRLQFTVLRAMLATTLIAMGLACWPLASVVENAEYKPFDLAPVLILLCFALPAAGVGSLLSRTLKGLYVGLAVGIALGLSFFVYVISRLDQFY
jgi:uncharacterized membrane protein YfcA